MFNGKHFVITGASSGLGEALAKQSAKLGAHLTLTARRLDRLLELKKELVKLHPKIEILTIACDVKDKEAQKNVVAESALHFGSIDGFMANAGLGMWSRFSDLKDPDELKNLMEINYMGVVYGLFYALPYLRQSKGSFVAVSSIQGVIPVIYHTGYVASKFAVNGLIETIRFEEPDVHFLLALPSWISGTELRANALSSTEDHAIHVRKTHGRSAVSTTVCAQEIMQALVLRKTSIFIPKKYQCVPLLRDLFKGTFDRVVTNKVKGQLEH